MRARQGADIGNTGIFNQFEFFGHLLDISKNDATAWQVRTLRCVQQSLALITVLQIEEDHGPPKKPTSSASNLDDSFFECPWLKKGQAKKFEPSFQDDEMSEFDGISDNDGLVELYMDHEEDTFAGGPNQKHVGVGETEEKAPSEAGSAHSAGHKKTIATEMGLVEEALREIGRHLFSKKGFKFQTGNCPKMFVLIFRKQERLQEFFLPLPMPIFVLISNEMKAGKNISARARTIYHLSIRYSIFFASIS